MRDFTEYSTPLWTPGQVVGTHVPFHLEESDRSSPTWRKLMAHFQEELQSLRQRNDGDMDEPSRYKLIGQLIEIKKLLALNKARDVPSDEAAPF